MHLKNPRRPAVAGIFYPDDPRELTRDVQTYLASAQPARGARTPKALIAPHAGYVYSGPVAASAYAALEGASVRRVVLLGPSHRVALRGLAAPTSDVFTTPLGPIPLDRATLDALCRLPQVSERDDAHAAEHSLEVHLPFLQAVLGEFSLVPLVVGDATAEEVAEVLDAVWDGPETLIVVSSDLSHYYDAETARRLDAATTRAIATLDPSGLDSESACGRVPVRGLLVAARERGLTCEVLDVRNSGDTAGPSDRVVGYGSYAFA